MRACCPLAAINSPVEYQCVLQTLRYFPEHLLVLTTSQNKNPGDRGGLSIALLHAVHLLRLHVASSRVSRTDETQAVKRQLINHTGVCVCLLGDYCADRVSSERWQSTLVLEMYLVIYNEARQVAAWIRVLRCCTASTLVVGSNFARGMDIISAFVYVVVACEGGVHEDSCGVGDWPPTPRLISNTLTDSKWILNRS